MASSGTSVAEPGTIRLRRRLVSPASLGNGGGEDLKWKTTIQKCVGNICKLEFTPVKMDKAGVYSGQHIVYSVGRLECTPVKMDKAGVYSGQYIVYMGSWSLLRSHAAL